jgi:hypothetical protein
LGARAQGANTEKPLRKMKAEVFLLHCSKNIALAWLAWLFDYLIHKSLFVNTPYVWLSALLSPWLRILPHPSSHASTYPRNARLLPRSGIQNSEYGI